LCVEVRGWFFRSASGVLWKSGYSVLYRPDNGVFLR